MKRIPGPAIPLTKLKRMKMNEARKLLSLVPMWLNFKTPRGEGTALNQFSWSHGQQVKQASTQRPWSTVFFSWRTSWKPLLAVIQPWLWVSRAGSEIYRFRKMVDYSPEAMSNQTCSVNNFYQKRVRLVFLWCLLVFHPVVSWEGATQTVRKATTLPGHS